MTTFSERLLFGYTSLVYATCAIAFLSFTVWLHHFFTMGSGADVNAAFGIATMIIAVPTGVKVFDWIFTMYRGRIRFHTSMMYTLAFLVTFVIGGVTGVLLALPPVDYLVHNTTFLVAHFHNMLIPGALFGYFAGMNFWFPKAFGFRLDETWGKRSFWCWVIGFYLAFMPLYALGFMGMPRRMEHYDVAAWQPLLVVAALGAVFVLFALAFMVIQVVVSIRQRYETRDLTGDPWDGQTLEWMTASPPAPYNFAIIPHVEGRDHFHELKERSAAYQRPEGYEGILMPRNSGFGAILGAFSFVFGFAVVWYIWWLAIVSLVAMAVAVALRSSNDDTDDLIPAAKVAEIEDRRFRQLAEASRESPADEPHSLALASTSGGGA